MRAFVAILAVARLILIALGLDATAMVSMATTYKTVQSHLGVEPVFDVLPVCMNCLEPHPRDFLGSTCSKCDFPLYIPKHSKRKKRQ